MDTTQQTTAQTNTVELLNKFVNQRPGLEFANYGDSKSYRSESAEITRDKGDYYELLRVALRRYDSYRNLAEVVNRYFGNNAGRLQLKDNSLEYCTGQYFPTEYRPAACRVLVSVIWDSYRDEKNEAGEPIYKDGHELRKAIRRNFGRRINNNYFN